MYTYHPCTYSSCQFHNLISQPLPMRENDILWLHAPFPYNLISWITRLTTKLGNTTCQRLGITTWINQWGIHAFNKPYNNVSNYIHLKYNNNILSFYSLHRVGSQPFPLFRSSCNEICILHVCFSADLNTPCMRKNFLLRCRQSPTKYLWDWFDKPIDAPMPCLIF